MRLLTRVYGIELELMLVSFMVTKVNLIFFSKSDGARVRRGQQEDYYVAYDGQGTTLNSRSRTLAILGLRWISQQSATGIQQPSLGSCNEFRVGVDLCTVTC